MKSTWIVLFLLCCLLLGSCTSLPEVGYEQLAQTQAAETAAMAMATPTPSPTNTPAPTNTSLPTDTPTPTNTPVPSDTPTPTPDRTGTAIVQVTQAAGEMIEKISPVLQEYHLSTERGYLSWVQKKPVAITVEKYDESRSIPVDSKLTFTDFALYVEVSWESQSGLAGCGIVFHAEAEKDGEQYRFQTLRFKGVPLWIVSFWDDGKPQPGGMTKAKLNKAINQKQGSRNIYMLILEEKLLTVYANGVELGQLDITQRTDGQIHFLAFQESMKTTCTFENAWIWSLK